MLVNVSKREEPYGPSEGVFATIILLVLSVLAVPIVGMWTPLIFVMSFWGFLRGTIGFKRTGLFLPDIEDRSVILPFMTGFAFMMPVLGYIFAFEPMLTFLWKRHSLPGFDRADLGFLLALGLLLLFHFEYVFSAHAISRGKTTGSGPGERAGNFGVFHMTYSVYLTSHGFSILCFYHYGVLGLVFQPHDVQLGKWLSPLLGNALVFFIFAAALPATMVIFGLVQRTWYSLRLGRQISDLPSAPVHAAAAGLVDLTGSALGAGKCPFHNKSGVMHFRLSDPTGEICVELPEDLHGPGDDRFGIHYEDNAGENLLGLIAHAGRVRVVGDFVPVVSKSCFGVVKPWKIPVQRGILSAVASRLFDGKFNPFGIGRPEGIFWVGLPDEKPTLERRFIHMRRHVVMTALNMFGLALLLTKAISVLDK